MILLERPSRYLTDWKKLQINNSKASRSSSIQQLRWHHILRPVTVFLHVVLLACHVVMAGIYHWHPEHRLHFSVDKQRWASVVLTVLVQAVSIVRYLIFGLVLGVNVELRSGCRSCYSASSNWFHSAIYVHTQT